MKKRLLMLIMCLCLMLVVPVLAEDFAIDTGKVYTGMGWSYAQGYEPLMGKDGLNLSIPVMSSTVKGAITATLTMGNPDVSPFLDSEITKTVQQDNSGASWHVRFTLKLKRAAYNGLYSATLRLEGKGPDGTAVTQDISLTIPFRGASEEALQEPLEIVSVVSGGEGLRLGEPGEVQLTLRNTGKRNALTGVQVGLLDAMGDILPTGAHTVPAEDLNPGEETTVTIPVLLQPDSRPRLHILNISANYTLFSGETGSITRAFTLPVTQEMRLNHGRPEMPMQVTQGDLVNFTLPLMNMGKAPIHNALLTFHLPGLSEGDSVLAGTIEPGGTVQGKATFHAKDTPVGEVSGTVDINYEDAQGNTGSLTLPLSTQVVAKKPPVTQDTPAATAGAAPAEQEDNMLQLLRQWWPVAAAGLLAILLVWQGLYYRGKLHRMEEQRL